MEDRSGPANAIFVFVLALAVRLAWVIVVPTKPVGDFAMYVESAAHLVKFGELDPEYIFMPGYVFLLAAVQALGGGLLACKLVGVLAGAGAAVAVHGIAWQVWQSRRIALLAGLLCALWPAGIAQASVTGTDMPAAALMGLGCFSLVRHASTRRCRAAVLFGVFMGLASSIRAIAFPLCALAILTFRAAGLSWRTAVRGMVVACAVAVFLLSPWAVRNRLRYGETFISDSHGGVTALVGANPNTDGNYSRSLNRMFREVTGWSVLSEPHRQVDRTSLAMALSWIRFDPAFTLGQLIFKAERLLVRERGLFYWPLFRAGVLPPSAAFVAGCWRTALETLADTFWMVVIGAALAGLSVAILRRRWLVLSLLPFAAVLSALYIAIFSEPRYRFPITLLVFVLAAAGMSWAGQTAWDVIRERRVSRSARREIGLALALCLLVFIGAPTAAKAGASLRDQHRWSVQVCHVNQAARLCSWRRVSDNPGDNRPVVRGVWDGVGLALPRAQPQGSQTSAAETELDLPRGEYTVQVAGYRACRCSGGRGRRRGDHASRWYGGDAGGSGGGGKCHGRQRIYPPAWRASSPGWQVVPAPAHWDSRWCHGTGAHGSLVGEQAPGRES